MARKTKTTRRSKKLKSNVVSLFEYEIAQNDIKAHQEGPKQKHWNVLDIKNIKPLTEAQRAMIESYFQGNNIVGIGSAGSGKTYLSMWLALNTILSKETPQNKLIIVRSIVTTGKDMGALPGEIADKVAPFETPYRDAVNDLMGKSSAYDDMKDAGKILFIPTNHIRGNNYSNATIIVDEIQNLEFFELASVVTRLGHDSNLIAIGDGKQTDLNYGNIKTKSGFDQFIQVAKLMTEQFDIIQFTRNDIVRSKFVKSFICACEDLGLM